MVKKGVVREIIVHGQNYDPVVKWQDVYLECPDCREKSVGLNEKFRQSRVTNNAILCNNCKCIFKVYVKEVEIDDKNKFTKTS